MPQEHSVTSIMGVAKGWRKFSLTAWIFASSLKSNLTNYHQSCLCEV